MTISYKTFIFAKPSRIRLTKVDGFNRNFDVTRYLLLFGDYCLFLEKNLLHHIVIIHITSVRNKYQNRCYCNIFLEKCSHQLPKNNNNK